MSSGQLTYPLKTCLTSKMEYKGFCNYTKNSTTTTAKKKKSIQNKSGDYHQAGYKTMNKS